MDMMYGLFQCMKLYDEMIEGLQGLLDKGVYKSQAEMARAGNVKPMYVNRLLRGERSKNAQLLLNFIGEIGGQIIWPDEPTETAKKVHFVKPELISTDSPEEGPIDDQYMAVPLAKRPVAAGRGLIPEDKIESWVLVWKGQEAVRHRSNLAVVKIDNREGDSMVPTLHPGDLALIDRNDWKPKNPPGNIYLVQIPDGDEMSLAVKRVRIQVKEGKELIVFYSDNPEHGPEIYDVVTDYEGDLTRAIKGRVIWSWSDMTKK